MAGRKRKRRLQNEAPAAPVSSRVQANLRAAEAETARRLAGGRLSVDKTDDFALGGAFAIMAPPAAEYDWRLLSLDSKTLDSITVSHLLELMVDLSPDISRALWDFLRLCNPGWELRAKRPGSDEVDETAQAALDTFVERLVGLYGSLDVVIGRLFMGAFLRGGFFAELVLDERGRLPIDLVTPDPFTVRFRRITDEQRGPVWQLCQYNGLSIVELTRPTIIYVPVDPLPGVPYGRSLVAPALFSSLFLLSLLHDLRRVVAQQGYPRIDLSISLERLHAAMPADLEDDPEAVKKWVDAMVREVQAVYASLQPDDAYIHTDVINVNRPVGTVDTSSLGAVGGLIQALERMITRALKTMPLLMVDASGVSEANANRQWEVHAAGIKSLQHVVETMLQRLSQLALQAQGLRADVEFRFSELRAAELQRDAQTEALQIANTLAKYAAGWISQEEAAEEITAHAPDQPGPRTGGLAGAPSPDLMAVQTEPGSNRFARPASQAVPDPVNRIKIIPEGASDPLPVVPDEVEITDADERRAIDAWDAAMPDYAGLLEADIVGREAYDAEEDAKARAVPARQAFQVTPFPSSHEAGDWHAWNELNGERYRAWQRACGGRSYGERSSGSSSSPWVWEQAQKRYRNQQTGQFIGPRQMLPLRDLFIEAQRKAAGVLAQRLADGEITTARFVSELRALIKSTFYDEYVLARGGRKNMTHRDNGIVGRMCRAQYAFLNDFAAEINAGKLSPAQIWARSRLYTSAAVQAYERSAAEVRGITGDLRLPAMPGDGTSACRANCCCTWEFQETATAWECTWTLHPAEHCADCLERSVKWAPYIVPKN